MDPKVQLSWLRLLRGNICSIEKITDLVKKFLPVQTKSREVSKSNLLFFKVMPLPKFSDNKENTAILHPEALLI